VIVRGPSGAGKSTVSRILRRSLGRGTALVEQDYVRRTLLQEKDRPDALNIALLDTIVRQTLDAGRNVVLEGILATDHYGATLRALIDSHQGTTVFVHLDVPFAETVRRHRTRPRLPSSLPPIWPAGGTPITGSASRVSSSLVRHRPWTRRSRALSLR
jgi:predicted kinase